MTNARAHAAFLPADFAPATAATAGNPVAAARNEAAPDRNPVGPADNPAAPLRPTMSPRLAACCEIVMGVTMSYMLITML